MSFDLQIATRAKPSQGHIDAFVAQNPGLLAEGRLTGGDTNVLVEKISAQGPSPLFTVDGPSALRADDYPDMLLAAAPAAKWHLLVSVPAMVDDEDIAVAEAFACYVADQCEGAVFDPQEDVIL